MPFFYWEIVSELSDVYSYMMRMNPPPQVSLRSTKWVGLCPLSNTKDSTLALGFCLSRNSKNTQSPMNWDAVPVRPDPMEREKGIRHWFLCRASTLGLDEMLCRASLGSRHWHEKPEVKAAWGWVRRKLLGRQCANGIEQFSSNRSISNFKFDKYVRLLLGKNRHFHLTMEELEVQRK